MDRLGEIRGERFWDDWAEWRPWAAWPPLTTTAVLLASLTPSLFPLRFAICILSDSLPYNLSNQYFITSILIFLSFLFLLLQGVGEAGPLGQVERGVGAHRGELWLQLGRTLLLGGRYPEALQALLQAKARHYDVRTSCVYLRDCRLFIHPLFFCRAI